MEYSRAPFIDWLSFTLPYGEESMDFVARTFGEPDPTGGGIKGYSDAARLPCGGIVAWSPARPSNRLYVSLPALALAEYREHAGAGDPRRLLREIMLREGKVTRLDLAKDDFGGNLRISRVYLHARRGWLVTKFRNGGINGSWAFNAPEQFGATIYFGNRVSESFVRVYDKTQQMRRVHEMKDVPENWIRCEFEFKRDRAHEIARRFVAGRLDISELFYRYVDFKQPGTAEEIRNWSTCGWWLRFLDVERKSEFTWPKYRLGLDEVREWIEDQCAGALFLLVRTYGEDALIKLIHEQGQEKLERNGHYQRLLAGWEQSGRDPLAVLAQRANRVEVNRRALRSEGAARRKSLASLEGRRLAKAT